MCSYLLIAFCEPVLFISANEFRPHPFPVTAFRVCFLVASPNMSSNYGTCTQGLLFSTFGATDIWLQTALFTGLSYPHNV